MIMRHNPVAQTPGSSREVVIDSKYKMVMPPYIPETPVGLSRIQDEPFGRKRPSDNEMVPAINSTNSSLVTFPYINEIYGRVIKDMQRYGFVNDKRVSDLSIPMISSTFRTYSRQKELFQKAVDKYGSPSAADDYVANPDGPKSPTPHMTGRAIDFSLLIPNTTEMEIALGTDNRKIMWNSGKWKIFNFLLTNVYKAMNLVNEPWHYEFGEISIKNLDKIKTLEKQGYIIGLPKIPDYLMTSTFIDVEAARRFNSENVPTVPYRIEFDTGSADFAFYIANKQKQLGLAVDGMCGPKTYQELVKDFNKGGDTPPQLKDLQNIPPTSFDLDNAFEFLKPKAAAVPTKTPKDASDAVAQAESDIEQNKKELEEIQRKEAEIRRERERQEALAREEAARLKQEADLEVRRQLEAKAKLEALEREAQRKKLEADLIRKKKELQLEQLKLLKKRAQAIQDLEEAKESMLKSLQQTRQSIQSTQIKTTPYLSELSVQKKSTPQGFKFTPVVAISTIAVASGIAFYFIRKNKKSRFKR
jgi:hypothetical protein